MKAKISSSLASLMRCSTPSVAEPADRRVNVAATSSASAGSGSRLSEQQRLDIGERGTQSVVRIGRGGRELGEQMRADGGDGGMVEGQRRRQAQPGVGLKPVPQLDGGERVEAELDESPVGIDRRRPGIAQDGGDMRANQVDERLRGLRLGERGEAGPQVGGRGGGGCGGFATRRDQGLKDRGQGAGVGAGTEAGDVEGGGDEISWLMLGRDR